VDFIFTYSDEGAGASAGEGVTRQYFMTVNVTNNVDPSAGSDYMNGFDLINAAAPVSGDLDSAQLRNRLPTNITDLTFEDDGGASKYNISNGFRFGGLAGGGKALYNGDSGSAIIQYTVTADADRDGGSRLTFTANPEPGTLALAGLALFPLGIAVRRRRKAAQQAEEV
jgi:hypothetical protein